MLNNKHMHNYKLRHILQRKGMIQRHPIETEVEKRNRNKEVLFGLRVKNEMSLRNWRLIFRSNLMNVLIFNHL